jgi:hypothetical protein
MYQRNLS